MIGGRFNLRVEGLIWLIDSFLECLCIFETFFICCFLALMRLVVLSLLGVGD